MDSLSPRLPPPPPSLFDLIHFYLIKMLIHHFKFVISHLFMKTILQSCQNIISPKNIRKSMPGFLPCYLSITIYDFPIAVLIFAFVTKKGT